MGGIGDANERELNAVNLAGNIAIDMFDRMVAETQGRGASGGRGRGWTDNGRRGIDEATLDRARFQMVAGAMVAIRAELGRLEGSTGRDEGDANDRVMESGGGRGGGRRGGANDRSMIIPGTLTPSLWDLDVMDGMPSDNDDVRGGWGWNNLFSDIGISADGGDAAVLERLEILVSPKLSIIPLF
ncbi:hypothetical protein BDZ94DRAFT_1260283 [Collybia nuda]|uniref:Uncharacterized protein n=1 Tax=Collybia nuda TaxID=64659 RepID=A0A9P5Y767_9AGAR|nr:hypothetical protein BDZ94DRAFT_1260283 [Collybia nuda]